MGAFTFTPADIINPAASAAGAYLGYHFNQKLMEQQHGYNMEENEHAAGLNYKYNELSAGAADKRARAFYNDFNSPEAIRRQLEAAGLSVGLMYGGAGAGGQGHASNMAPQGEGGGNQQGKTVTPNGAMIGDMALVASEVEKNLAQAGKDKADANATNTYKKALFEAEKINWDIKNARDYNTLGADVIKAWSIIDNMEADTQVKQMQAFETLTRAWDNIAGINLKQEQAEELKAAANYYNAAAENFGLTREMEERLRKTGFEVEMLKNNGKLGLMLWYGKKYLDLFDMDNKGHALGKPQDGPTTGVYDKNGTRTGYKMGDWGGMK